MAGLPPWSAPTDYCTSMAGIWFTNSTAGNVTATNKLFGLDAKINSGPWGDYSDPQSSTTSWTSDNVFCMASAATFWQTCLFIALAFWGFFTVLQLFSTLDIRHGHGHTMARSVNLVLRHMVVLILAISSFFLMLLAHQLLFLIVDTLAGGNLGQWRVDSLWVPGFAKYGDQSVNNVVGGNVYMVLDTTHTMVAQSTPFTNVINALSNGNAPNQDNILGTAFGQLYNAIVPLQETMNQGWPMIDFLITFLLTCTAPIAIVFATFEYTRPAFNLWLKSATELVGLALITAAGVGIFQHLICNGQACNPFRDYNNGQYQSGDDSYYDNPNFPLHNISRTTLAWLFLGFSGLVVGLEIAYMWRLVSSFISFGTSASQADYDRGSAGWKMLLNALPLIGALVGASVGVAVGGVAAAGEAGESVGGGMIEGAATNAQRGMTVGNYVTQSGQVGMSMIPQRGGSTMASLPDFENRGIANFRPEIAYFDNNGVALSETEAASYKKRGKAEWSWDKNWRGGFHRIRTRDVLDANGKKVGTEISKFILGRRDIADSLTQATLARGLTRGAAYERAHGLQPIAGGGQALGLNHLVTPAGQLQPDSNQPVQQLTPQQAQNVIANIPTQVPRQRPLMPPSARAPMQTPTPPPQRGIGAQGYMLNNGEYHPVTLENGQVKWGPPQKTEPPLSEPPKP
jgi:hypothetical protein